MRVYGMVKGFHGDDERGTRIFPDIASEWNRERRKRCEECGEELPLEAFPPDKRTRDGRSKVCLACRKDERC
jgi:hypothetical protein